MQENKLFEAIQEQIDGAFIEEGGKRRDRRIVWLQAKRKINAERRKCRDIMTDEECLQYAIAQEAMYRIMLASAKRIKDKMETNFSEKDMAQMTNESPEIQNLAKEIMNRPALTRHTSALISSSLRIGTLVKDSPFFILYREQLIGDKEKSQDFIDIIGDMGYEKRCDMLSALVDTQLTQRMGRPFKADEKEAFEQGLVSILNKIQKKLKRGEYKKSQVNEVLSIIEEKDQKQNNYVTKIMKESPAVYKAYTDLQNTYNTPDERHESNKKVHSTPLQTGRTVIEI